MRWKNTRSVISEEKRKKIMKYGIKFRKRMPRKLADWKRKRRYLERGKSF